jgi:hypothetical protein
MSPRGIQVTASRVGVILAIRSIALRPHVVKIPRVGFAVNRLLPDVGLRPGACALLTFRD